MATVEITSKNFAETLEQGGIVLLDWWAPWCGPCRAFGPIYERAAAQNPDIVFGKINTEEQRDLARSFSISSIPTLMIIRDKVLIYSKPGMLPDKALAGLIDQVRKLDMEQVQREATASEQQAANA